MKKKIALIGVAGMLVLAAAIGGTLASLNSTTENGAGTGVAKITTNALSISGEGTVRDKTAITEGATPGGNYACSFNIKNDTREEAYSFYAKVTLYKYWRDDAEELDASLASFSVAGTDGEYVSYKADQTAPVIVTSNTPYIQNDWIVAYQDDEQLVLYYTKPLAKGESSTNYLDAVRFEHSMDNRYAGKTLQLEFELTAVQMNSSEDAMQAEFGVFPLINKQGDIVSIFETRAARDAYRNR